MESKHCDNMNTRGVVDDVSLKQMLRSIEELSKGLSETKSLKENTILCIIILCYILLNYM